MKKLMLLLGVLFFHVGFSFPKDIGLIEINDLQATQQNLNEYFAIDGEYEYTEDNFSDGSKYYNYELENVGITMEQDNSTIQDITITDLSSDEARQLLIDLGVYPDRFTELNLEFSKEVNSNLYIGEDKAVALRNTAKFPDLYSDQEYFIVNIVFSEESVQDFIDGQISELNGESEFNEIATEVTEMVDSIEDANIPQEYKNALTKAEQYAEVMNMSKLGIYDQLISQYGEGFPEDAAQYAVDNLEVDWNAAALEKAKSYYEQMSMSKSAIYEQLISEHGEQFTPEQAQYAIDNLE